MDETKSNKLSTPVAIIIAGIVIALGAFFGISQKDAAPQDPNTTQQAEKVRDVQPDDHIIGNADAKIVIIEYSDTECPYCAVHHERLHELVEQYDPSEVAWVYRHFPVHQKSPVEAQATECAAELGGEEAFWSLLDMIYAETPANDQFDLALLPEFAEKVGLDKAAFEGCLASERHQEKIQNHFNEIVAAGGRGTPHNIFVVDGEHVALEGTQPIETLVEIVDQMLAQ